MGRSVLSFDGVTSWMYSQRPRWIGLWIVMDPRKEADELEYGSDVLYSDRDGQLRLCQFQLLSRTPITRDPAPCGSPVAVIGK